jgi:hypothetical protein
MRPTTLIVNGNREIIIDAIDLQKGSGSKVNQATALILESGFNRSDISASSCSQFAEADGTTGMSSVQRLCEILEKRRQFNFNSSDLPASFAESFHR